MRAEVFGGGLRGVMEHDHDAHALTPLRVGHADDRAMGERGYDQVGMSDIADAAAIGPSALYRHYTGKQDMLRGVIADNLAPLGTLLAELDLAAEGAARMAAVSMDHPRNGVLWQREAHHLTPDDLKEVRAGVDRTAHLVSGELDPRRADLLSWAVLSVLASPSFHSVHLHRPDYEKTLTELVGRVLDTSLPPSDRATGHRNGARVAPGFTTGGIAD